MINAQQILSRYPRHHWALSLLTLAIVVAPQSLPAQTVVEPAPPAMLAPQATSAPTANPFVTAAEQSPKTIKLTAGEEPALPAEQSSTSNALPGEAAPAAASETPSAAANPAPLPSEASREGR